MTVNEALNILHADEYDDVEEALSWQLFEWKKKLKQKHHVPKVIENQIAKLKSIQQAAQVLQLEESPSMEIPETPFQGTTLLDIFNAYQHHRGVLMHIIFTCDHIDTLVRCSERLIVNLKQFAQFWMSITLEEIPVLLSSEMDTMQFYETLKELDNKGIRDFNQLNNLALESTFKHEILRLQKIARE